MTAPTPDQLHIILENSLRAPSADNHHRIRFTVGDGMLSIRHTDDVPAPEGGYKRALFLLSLGALSENLALTASHFGIKAEIDLYPDTSDPTMALWVRWLPGEVTDPLWEAIPKRHTNRSIVFHGPRLSGEEKSRLDQAASAFINCELAWLDNPQSRRHALRGIWLAESERFRNRLLHKELFSAIRFDIGWRRSCDEGLPPGALGVERPLRPAFSMLRHWPIMRLANLLGGHYLLGLRSTWLPSRFSPHLGMIAVDEVTDRAVFAAGRCFERIWLAATQLGLALQPLPASALYALEGSCQEGIPPNLQSHLKHGWEVMLPGKQPLMLFRIGRAHPPGITAGRKPLDDYISQE